MNFGGAQNKTFLTQDNSKIKQEVQTSFARGDNRYNTGSTVQEKEEGLSLIMMGLKNMKLWISRKFQNFKISLKGENDSQLIGTLTEQYNARTTDVKNKLDYLEKYKKGEVVQDSGSSQNGVQVKRPPGQGKGDDKKNDEDDKLDGAISQAIVTDKPNVKWSDIAGLHQAKAALSEAVILPIRFPQIFEGARTPWKGILMFGPPGTGKTFLAKACATEADGTFFSVSSSDLISKFVGESERLIKSLFKMAREKKPSIIFIDEIDSMCGARGEGQNEASRRVITEFLIQMQGVGHDDRGLLVLGATNLPWALDAAIRRRFEKRIYIPLPDEEARLYMIKNTLKGNKHDITEQQMEDLAKRCDGYSGSDISILVRDAVYEPVRSLQTHKKFKYIMIEGQRKLTPAQNGDSGPDIKECYFMDIPGNELYIPPVNYNDFLRSLTKSKSSVSQDQLQEYVDWTKQFGQEG